VTFLQGRTDDQLREDYPATEYGTALRLADEWAESLVWMEEIGKWLVRREGESTWRVDSLVQRTEKAMITCLAQADLHAVVGLSRLHHMKNALELAKPRLAVEAADFDQNPWMLNTPAGVINLQTSELVPPAAVQARYRMSTRIAPKRMETPFWSAHLQRLCRGDVEILSFLKRLAGITLIGDQNLKPHLSPQLNGLGRNGKGVFLQGLGWALGDYAQFASTRLLTTTENAHTTEQAGLRGMRLVVVEEVKRINSSLLKDLTGGGVMRARRMRADDEEFLKSWTLWFNNNGPLMFAGDTSDGLWQRVPRIDFGEGIPEVERIWDMSEKFKPEAPGVLQWMLDGLVEYQELGEDLCIPEIVRQRTEERRLDADPLRMFLNEMYEREEDGFVRGSEFTKNYSVWAKDREERTGGMRAVYDELRSRFGLKVKSGHENKTYIYGIKARQTTMSDLPGSWN
jgi:putative DNA primase/helicase